MASIVEQYFEALGAHDWQALRATLTNGDLVRVGPFCERIDGVEPYVEYLAAMMPSLERYELRMQQMTTVGHRTFVELTETLDVGGQLITYPECLIFEVDDDGLINDVRVFLQTPPGG